MELVEVDDVHAEGLERGVELSLDAGEGEIVVAVQEAVEVVAELGGDDPTGAVATGEVIADEYFGEVVAVTFGGVDEVDAALRSGVEDGIDLGLGSVLIWK
jgi:hypothetical protein